jgi:hypothetical protein
MKYTFRFRGLWMFSVKSNLNLFASAHSVLCDMIIEPLKQVSCKDFKYIYNERVSSVIPVDIFNEML